MAYLCGIETIKYYNYSNPEMMDFTISIPKVDLKRFKGLAKAMGWVFEKKEPEIKAVEAEEWTAEQEREAFLHTSRVNAAKMCAKYL